MNLFAGYRKAARLAHGARLAAMIRFGGGDCGPGLEVEPGTQLRWGGHPGIRLGAGVRFGRGVMLDVPPGARLEVGDGVKVMHYTVIAAAEAITIGPLAQVAEHCSLRDSDHGLAVGRPIGGQSVSSPTTIGSDAWIAAGARVLRGSVIGDGAVLGANSVLKGELPPRAIAVGAPARVVRYRSGDDPQGGEVAEAHLSEL